MGVLSAGPLLVIPSVLMIICSIVAGSGLVAVQPNSSRVLLLFGDYKGTIKESGFYWVNPFYSKQKVSLRIRNFETGSTTTPEQRDATGNNWQRWRASFLDRIYKMKQDLRASFRASPHAQHPVQSSSSCLIFDPVCETKGTANGKTEQHKSGTA